jgi:hypothetical protein
MNITEEFREKVGKAAAKVARAHSSLNVQDVEQDIWLRLYENPDYLTKMLEVEDPFNAIVKIGRQVASEEISALEYFSGNYTYTPGEVRLILGRCLMIDPELEGIAAYVDLHEGMDMLKKKNKAYHKVIVDKWLHGIEPKDAKYTQRSVAMLTSLMNQLHKSDRYSHNGPGARRVMSNAQSQAQGFNQMEQNKNGGTNWN